MTGFARFVLVLLVAATAAAAAFADRAGAISPEQTTELGVVNTLGYDLSTGAAAYGSIDNFWAYAFSSWRKAYARPSIRFYGGTYGNYATGCDSTSRWPNNGFYCWNDGGIYLDYPFLQSKLVANGDYYPGAFLAHEWGHRIQHHLGAWAFYEAQGYRTEYHADCLAGMYTRYGYSTRRLVGSDYWEGYNWLYYQPQSPSHGYGPYRAAWYEYGYTQYSLEACNRVFSAATGGSAGSAFAGQGDRTGSVTADMRIAPPTRTRPDLTPARSVAPPKGDASPPIHGKPLTPSRHQVS